MNGSCSCFHHEVSCTPYACLKSLALKLKARCLQHICSCEPLKAHLYHPYHIALCTLYQKSHHACHAPANHKQSPSIIQPQPPLLQPSELLLLKLILFILQPTSKGYLLLVHWHHDEHRPRGGGDVGGGSEAQVGKLGGSDGIGAAVEVCDDAHYDVGQGAGGVQRGEEVLATHPYRSATK
jgi:hypothetical protein